MLLLDLQVAALLNNNSVQVSDVEMVDAHNVKCSGTASIDRGGHRTEVRTLAFSSDSNMILTASAEQAKLWSRCAFYRHFVSVIRTLEFDLTETPTVITA